MIVATIRRVNFFVQLLSEYSSLPFQDQKTLLTANVLEISILISAYDSVTSRSSSVTVTTPSRNSTFDTLKSLTVEFICSLQKLGPDELTIILLSLIILFASERSSLVRSRGIEKHQLHFALLLKRYIVWRYGVHQSHISYGKYLLKLSDLRELSERDELQVLRGGKIIY